MAKNIYDRDRWDYYVVSCDGTRTTWSQSTSHGVSKLFGEIQWDDNPPICPEFPDEANGCVAFYGPFMYGRELRVKGITWTEHDHCGEFRRDEAQQDISVRSIHWNLDVPRRDENGEYVLEGSREEPLLDGWSEPYKMESTWRFVMTPVAP